MGAFGSLRGRSSIDPDNCNLGTKALFFKNMLVKQAQQITKDGSIQNLALECHFEWLGNPSILFITPACTVGIKKLEMQGVMLIEIVGLLPRPPFFQGLRVGFMNTPNVNMEFT